jgi:ABC-type transport system involved in multi-copper enzyme maturation permease subunit
MRLIRGELLKIRRRSATYVVLVVALVLMGVIFLIAGVGFKLTGLIEFPFAYTLISQFAFGLGGLLGVVYAAAFVGADWNWGVLRNVIARGESRAAYLLAKAAALAIVLAIATLIIFLVGIVMAYATGFIYGIPVASPLRGRGLQDLVENIVLGYPVLLERAALGIAVAVVLRSQLAGAVVGIVLFLGESVIKTLLIGLTLPGRFGSGFGSGSFETPGPEWFQFLPVSVGDYVVGAAPGNAVSLGGGIEQFLIKPVPLEQALPAVLIYLVLSLLIAIFALNRQEIT